MRKVYKKFEAYFPAGIFLVICIVMLAQIFLRTIFKISFSWSLEFSRYAQVWLTFIGIAYLRRINAHIKIEALSDGLNRRLSRKGSLVFYLVKSVIVLIFMILLVVLGVQLVLVAWKLRSSAMNIRQSWLYVAVPLGAAGFVIREIQNDVKFIKELRSRK